MKILKTAIIILVVLIAISVIAYFIPFDKIANLIPIVNKLYNNTSLTINSRNGKATIAINGKDYGQTPLTITDLAAGEYEIRMNRISDSTNFYSEKMIKVELHRNTEAVIDIEIGPMNITSGYVLYYTESPMKSDGKGYITINSDPTTTSVYLNDEFFQKTPVNAFQMNNGNYNIKVTNLGYEQLTFPVIVRNGYNLNITTYLFPIPTDITKK